MNTKPFVIYNPSEYSQSEDGAGFWSNEDGWVPLENATRYEDAPDGMLPLGGQSLEIGSMKDYRLQVFETPGDKEPITFICFAEDRAHAVEQALDSYPDGRVLSYNTKLTLLYRDANNYKQSQEVILQGAITPEQVEAIIKRTADLGEFGAVIADQINLPTPAEKMMDIQDSLGWPNPESDHVYTDIIEIIEAKTGASFDANKLAESMWVEPGKEDDDAHDTGMSVDDLVGLLNEIQFWDIEHEVSRQAEIGNYKPGFGHYETIDY